MFLQFAKAIFHPVTPTVVAAVKGPEWSPFGGGTKAGKNALLKEQDAQLVVTIGLIGDHRPKRSIPQVPRPTIVAVIEL